MTSFFILSPRNKKRYCRDQCILNNYCAGCQDYHINHYTFDYYNTLRNLIFVFVEYKKKAPTLVGA